jgi:D-xylose transport system permease protein
MTLDNTKVQTFFKKYTMILALLAIWLLFQIITQGVFLGSRNVSNLFRQMTITSFLACGMLLVIITGGIDLSVGSVAGFISALAAFLQAVVLPKLLMALMPEADIVTRGILSTVITILASVGVGILVGSFQGSIISYLGVPAFIVTLGGQMIFRGGVLGVTGGKTIVPIEPSLVFIAQGYVGKLLGIVFAAAVVILLYVNMFITRKKKQQYGFALRPFWQDILIASFLAAIVMGYVLWMNQYRGIQVPVLLLAVTAFVMHYITQNTRFGRYVYAIGGNKEATRLSGINIKKNLFMVYVLMGFFGAIAGIVLTGYVAAGTTGGGVNYELDAIASCVIGGTSLAGGSGSIFGALTGALVMASLINGMSVMNMPIFWQFIVKGSVLILAVFFDIISKKKTT